MAKCPRCEKLVGTQFEAVIIKDMTLINLVKQIATDVNGIKTDIINIKNDIVEIRADVAILKTDVADLKVRMTKVENRLDKQDSFNKVVTDYMNSHP